MFKKVLFALMMTSCLGNGFCSKGRITSLDQYMDERTIANTIYYGTVADALNKMLGNSLEKRKENIVNIAHHALILNTLNVYGKDIVTDIAPYVTNEQQANSSEIAEKIATIVIEQAQEKLHQLFVEGKRVKFGNTIVPPLTANKLLFGADGWIEVMVYTLGDKEITLDILKKLVTGDIAIAVINEGKFPLPTFCLEVIKNLGSDIDMKFILANLDKNKEYQKAIKSILKPSQQLNVKSNSLTQDKNTARNIAKNLLNSGVSDNIIRQATGLSNDEIEQLRKENIK